MAHVRCIDEIYSCTQIHTPQPNQPGRSKLVGLPIALLFLAKHATVTIAHSKTPQAELQGTCIGRGLLIHMDMNVCVSAVV